MNGWIKVYRQIQESWLWNSREPFDKRSAWIDLLMLANYTDGEVALGTTVENISRGSLITSENNLMIRWKWSKNKVRLFLKLLQDENMIEKVACRKWTRINVVNYSVYQDLQTTNEPQMNHGKTTGEPQTDCKRTTEEPLKVNNIKNKEYKEDKKERNNANASTAKEHEREAEELFNRLWQLYPKKRGKGQVSMTRKLKLRKIGYDKLAEAIDAYKEELLQKNTSEEYTMNGSTFFNSGYIDFLPEGDSPQKSLYSEEDVERLKRLGIDID